ncbi:thiol reductant ABC exporter subunit CydD [Thermochromatium tepidum]|uniref:Thiol reductant ABC exporter subunit CydD n=1 Tax=Thermochromatium tepidum ATCC 43061 TaxID=316276 RepID=A0A6I6DZM3_THETI|nr:thiol reductant ABC exporter subunit CydD [Thermochromatium tepidum]QGU33064.1 thiol reductant ABC exporter subunit CydD [Thermochromatium tepidum ATCC 43061]
MSVNAWLKAQRPLADRSLVSAIWLNTANGLLAINQAWALAVILDAVIFKDADLTEVRSWLWGLLALFATRALIVWHAERAAFQAAASVRVKLRDQVYRHLQRLGPAYLSGQQSGALIETLTKGIDDLEGYYARFVPAMALVMILPPAILVAVMPMDWLSGLIMLITAPLIPLFMILIGSGAEARNRQQWQRLARLGAHFLDVIQGLTTLKLFGASRREIEILARISDEYRHSTMQVLRIAFLSSAVLEFFASVGIALVAVLIGFRLYDLALPVPDWIPIPNLTYLQGLFVLMLAPEFYAHLRHLGTQYHARLGAVAAAEQLVQILDTQPSQINPGKEPLAATPPFGVRFDEVSFSYEPGREVLKGLSLEIPPGQCIALIGPSGAGKTTVINLLLGFLVPTRGRILIGWQSLAELDLDDWRRHLAWVPQQPRLFQGTIADNIRLGRPEADLATVRAAARRARADAFIETLPLGYDSPVGERGTGLSGGQIQRIALARAFVRDAPLVILDEPTANLDPESERLVQEGIAELARDRTLLVIAHRLSTVRRADRILVLDQGRLIEQGTHDELIAAGGFYARMLAAQGPLQQGGCGG